VIAATVGCGDPLCGVGQEDLSRDVGMFFQHGVVVDLALESDDLEELADAPGADVPDIHAELRFDDETYDVGLKLKGSGSFRTIEQKASMKIDLGEWVSGQTLHGLRRLTLNNMMQSPSQLSESLAYTLLSAAGVPSPRHGFACVEINGKPYGLYSVVETMDEQFVERAFGDDGTLWEAWDRSDFTVETFRRFELEEGDAAALEDMERFVADLDAAEPDTLPEVLDAWTERDDLLSLWAVDALIGNYDGYGSFTHNFLVYHAPSTERFSLIPWGVDLSFEREVDPYRPVDPLKTTEQTADARMGRLFVDCMASAPCTAAYEARLLAIADLIEEIDLAGWARTQRRWLRGSHRVDPLSENSKRETRRARREVEDYIEDQPDRIREAVE